MAQFAFIRWTKGLIPAFIMLFLMACITVLVWVSVWGLPASVRHLVEDGLRNQGIDVEMGNLRVSIWGGLFLEASDVRFHDKLVEEQETSTAERLRLDLDMDSLWRGVLRLDRLEVVEAKVMVPLRNEAGLTGRLIVLNNANVILSFDADDNIDIREATGVLQGMKINVSGRIEAGGGKGTSLSKEDIERIISQVDQAAIYLEEIKWPQDSPPSWNIRFTGNNKQGASRAVAELEAVELRYKHLRIRDLILDTEFSGSRIWVKKLSCREMDGRGKLEMVSQIDLERRSVQVGFLCEVPILTWIRQVTGKRLLPLVVDLKSVPTLKGEASTVFADGWSSVDEVKARGSVNVGRFDINELPFLRLFTRFSYEKPNGAGFDRSKFYVTEFNLVQDEQKLDGQVLGVDGQLSFELRNTLSVPTMLHLAYAFSKEKFQLPKEFEVRGIPDFLLKGTVGFPDGWMSRPEIETGRVMLKLADFSLLGVDLGSVALDASVEGKDVTINQCSIWNDGRQFDFKGGVKGNEIHFACTSNIPPSLFNELINGSAELREKLKLPPQLKLPENADFSANGFIAKSESGAYRLESLEMSLKADKWEWNSVDFDNIDFSMEMFGERIQYLSLDVSRKGKLFDLFIQGDLAGEMMVIGQSTFRLDTFDRLLALEDDNFFYQRFKYTDTSSFDFGFIGRVDLSNPLGTYQVNASLKAADTYYQGVLVKSASTDIGVAANVATLKDVKMQIDQSSYLSAEKLPGGVVNGSLTAAKVVLDFNRNSAAVENLKANAYPAYALKMFSPAAADVLAMFRCHAPLSISGSGVFPMEDDFSMMTASLAFSGGRSTIEYKILGTTLNMTNVSGAIGISPEWVRVTNLKGNAWGGRFEGRIDAQIDKGDAINGVIAARELDLAQIGRSYDTKMNPAKVEASLSFRSRNGNVNTMTGQGMMQLRNGNLVEIPIFGLLGEAIGSYIPGIGHLINYNITTAGCDFYIEKGVMKTQTFSAEGSNMALNGSGTVNLDTTQVNANFQLRFRGIPWLLTSPVYIVAGGLFRVEGKGPLNNVNWSLAPFSRAKN